MSLALIIRVAIFLAVGVSVSRAADDQWQRARSRMGDLRFAVYATSAQVESLARDEAVRAQAWNAIRQMGITKVFVEVYRGGHVVAETDLIAVRNWLQGIGIDVVGGIATVPGGDFGKRQEGPLGWFNWQNAKTQRDLSRVMRQAAPIFDTFIIDDFLCTADVSDESEQAKGSRGWGEYRRELMSEMARSVLIGPAREANPSITMIVKYPQWYDRFHLFGYDTETLPQMFDRVWVGTETRGRTTQRFGFVQPFEGFVNYRRLADIAGPKIAGAWFDHGDCGPHDFLDQAYMSVLAGAPEIVFFNFGDVLAGHRDHEHVVAQFDQLANLASLVRMQPVAGIPAYMPANSDPAGDMYLLDFLGMLGIPLVPVHQFPEQAPVILLPAHAAADTQLMPRLRDALARGTRLILTTNLLIATQDTNALARIAGLKQVPQSQPLRVQVTSVSSPSPSESTDVAVDLEAPLEAPASGGNIVGTSDGKRYALLIAENMSSRRVAILNTHTFSQADFDAVGEVLLCPRPLGILALAGEPLLTLRAAFRGDNDAVFEGPSCVTWHPLTGINGGNHVVQNFNDHDVQVKLTLPWPAGRAVHISDEFAGQHVDNEKSAHNTRATVSVTVPARGRVWLSNNE